MQNEIQTTSSNGVDAGQVGKRKVDVSRGEVRTDLNKECFSRPHDERFLSMDDLIAELNRQKEFSEEYTVNLSDLTFLGNPETDFLGVEGPNGEPLSFSHWSMTQMSQALGAPSDYIRNLPAHVAALNMQVSATRYGEGAKLYVDTQKHQVRAVTSPSYGRIHSVDVAERLQFMAENSDVTWKVPGCMDWPTNSYDPNAPVTMDSTTLFAGDRDFAAFLCNDLDPIEVGKLDDGSPDLMFRGIFARNSEVGFAKFDVMTALMRGICANRCMWGVEGFEQFEIVHTSAAPGRFQEEVRPFLDSFGTTYGDKQKLVDGVKLAKEPLVLLAGKDDAERKENQISFLTDKLGFGVKVAADILAHDAPGTPHMLTGFDVTNKLTSYAQTVPYQDKRLAIEQTASGFINKLVPAA